MKKVSNVDVEGKGSVRPLSRAWQEAARHGSDRRISRVQRGSCTQGGQLNDVRQPTAGRLGQNKMTCACRDHPTWERETGERNIIKTWKQMDLPKRWGANESGWDSASDGVRVHAGPQSVEPRNNKIIYNQVRLCSADERKGGTIRNKLGRNPRDKKMAQETGSKS